MTNESESKLLEAIFSSQASAQAGTQRTLADNAGISLGMTNFLLARFIERGWVELKHLSGRKLRYILTPVGMREALRRSVAYFMRAERRASFYSERIDDFVCGLTNGGFSTLVYEGPPGLDFLFSYYCGVHSIKFVKASGAFDRRAMQLRPDTMFVGMESAESPDSGAARLASSAKLIDILLGEGNDI